MPIFDAANPEAFDFKAVQDLTDRTRDVHMTHIMQGTDGRLDYLSAQSMHGVHYVRFTADRPATPQDGDNLVSGHQPYIIFDVRPDANDKTKFYAHAMRHNPDLGIGHRISADEQALINAPKRSHIGHKPEPAPQA